MANPEIEPIVQETKEKAKEARREIQKKHEDAGDTKVIDETKESSFSEAKLAKALEQFSLGDLDIDDVVGTKTFQSLTDQQKTVIVFHFVSKQLNTLIAEYSHLMENNVHQAQRLLDEIKRVRAKQKILLTKLFGKLDEEFSDREVLEKELEEMGI